MIAATMIPSPLMAKAGPCACSCAMDERGGKLDNGHTYRLQRTDTTLRLCSIRSRVAAALVRLLRLPREPRAPRQPRGAQKRLEAATHLQVLYASRCWLPPRRWNTPTSPHTQAGRTRVESAMNLGSQTLWCSIRSSGDQASCFRAKQLSPTPLSAGRSSAKRIDTAYCPVVTVVFEVFRD
jgi:hypothetical protein